MLFPVFLVIRINSNYMKKPICKVAVDSKAI